MVATRRLSRDALAHTRDTSSADADAPSTTSSPSCPGRCSAGSTVCDTGVENVPARRRLRARRQPHLELRPVAARRCRSGPSGSSTSWPRSSCSSPARRRSSRRRRASPCVAASATSRRSRRRCELCRDGDVVAMFPEGTRRRRGCARSSSPGRAPGSARIALAAGVPLVPAAIKGTDRLVAARASSGRLRRAVAIDDLRSPTARCAQEATDRLMARDPRARRRRCEAAARRRRRLVRASRLPRAAEDDPRANGRPRARRRLHEHAVRLWDRAAARRARRLGHARACPTYRHEAFAAVPGGPRVRRRRCSSSSTCCPSSSSAFGFAAAKAPGLRGGRLPRRRRRAEEKRGGTSLVATSDRDAFQLVERARRRSCSRSRGV